MDGTLLTDEKKLPPNLDQLIKDLQNRDILFSVSSGRQYETLKAMFENHLESMYFFTDNGSFVYYQDELISALSFTDDEFKTVLSRLQTLHKPLILSGSRSAYRLESNHPEIIKQFGHYYHEQEIVSDLSQVKDHIGKIALLDLEKSMDPTSLFADMDNVQVVHSGPVWWDIQPTSVNKGNALRRFLENHEINRKEVVVFGDFMNDYQMMKEADYSFAMANALPIIKEVSRFEAPSNNEFGVIQILEDILEERFEKKWIL